VKAADVQVGAVYETKWPGANRWWPVVVLEARKCPDRFLTRLTHSPSTPLEWRTAGQLRPTGEQQ
jgi:hypothetical protein